MGEKQVRMLLRSALNFGTLVRPSTEAAKELIAAGKMTGTVKQDAEGMAAAIASVVKSNGEGTAMADAISAAAATNTDMYTVADGIANKLFVAYAAYTK